MKIKRHDYIQGIERDLMAAIILSVEKNKTTETRVQKISQIYLSFIDSPSVENIARGIKQLGDMFAEIQEVSLKYWKMFVEYQTKIALKRAHIYLRNGNIEKALLTVKGGTKYV